MQLRREPNLGDTTLKYLNSISDDHEEYLSLYTSFSIMHKRMHQKNTVDLFLRDTNTTKMHLMTGSLTGTVIPAGSSN